MSYSESGNHIEETTSSKEIDVSQKIQLLDSLKNETPYNAFQKVGLNWAKDKGNYSIQPGSAENNMKILQKMIDTEKSKLLTKKTEALKPLPVVEKQPIVSPENMMKIQENLKQQSIQFKQKEIIQKGEESKNQIASRIEEGAQNNEGSDFAYELAIDDLLTDSSLFDNMKENSALRNATKPQLDGLVKSIQKKLQQETNKDSDNYKNLSTLEQKITKRIQKNTEKENRLQNRITKLTNRQEKLRNSNNPENAARAEHIANRIQNLNNRMTGEGTYTANNKLDAMQQQNNKLAEKFDISKFPPEKLEELKNQLQTYVIDQFNKMLAVSKKDNINLGASLNSESIKSAVTEFKGVAKSYINKPLVDKEITLIKVMRDVVAPMYQNVLTDIATTNQNPEIKTLANNTKIVINEIFSDQEVLIALTTTPFILKDLATRLGDKAPEIKDFLMNMGS